MTKTAAMLVIGDEILSGRTQDTNSNYVARQLTAIGIDLLEVRVVGDIEAEIVAALNALRHRYARSSPGGVSAAFRKSSIVSPKSARTSSIGT